MANRKPGIRGTFRSSTFLLIATVVILIGVGGFPFFKIKDLVTEEANKARTVVYALRAQMTGPQSKVFEQSPIDSTSTGEMMRNILTQNIFSSNLDNIALGVSDILPQDQALEVYDGNSAPAAPEPPLPLGPVLTGILIDGKISHAVINDSTVTNGDTVNGYRVVGISRNSVLLSKDGKIEEFLLQDK